MNNEWTDFETCNDCGRSFPDFLINMTVTTDGNFNSCPICALEYRNRIHGFPPGTPFHGETAKWYHELALKHLKEIQNDSNS